MTIVTTASNLEDLLEAKPTARGQVLSRFLGLEYLKKKEEIGKEIYSDFSKAMLSNVYNSETLKQDIETHKETITRLELEITENDAKILDVDARLKKGQEYKDNLISSKFTDLDQALLILNPDKLTQEIDQHKTSCKTIQKQIDEIKVVEPAEFYHEDKHDAIRDEITKQKVELGKINHKIVEIQELVNKFGDGIQCEHCGIKLMEASITKQKISELDTWKSAKTTTSEEIDKLELRDKAFVQLKKDFDDYERNKLIKEKHEVSLESTQLKLSQLEDKLKKYLEIQDKIKKNNEIDAQLVKASLRIDELISERRNYERVQNTNQVEITNLRSKIEKNHEVIAKIAEEFERERIYKIYAEIFGKNGISKIIMKTMMPLINSELQRLLEDSCYFNLEIRINDKNEVEFMMIDNSTGVEKLMVSGSGYEKTIAALALRSVLSKICSLPKPNIIVMDEVFGKISNDNLDLVGEFFVKIKEYFEKIFVISHNPLISNWADKVIRIKKQENISKVMM